MQLVSWNVREMAAYGEHLPAGTDVALIQESPASAGRPKIEYSSGPATVVGINPSISCERVELVDIPTAAEERHASPSSYPGTIDVARVSDPSSGLDLYAVSVYAKWEKTGRSWIVPDASAHRLISDLSSLITSEQHAPPLIVAGDWNLFHETGETRYWSARYQSVFSRMEALGFAYLGPNAPDGGLHREPLPKEKILPLPPTSTPTYRTSSQTPSQTWRQLDHVFVSRSIADRVMVRALNDPAEWGPSDHCRIVIDIE